MATAKKFASSGAGIVVERVRQPYGMPALGQAWATPFLLQLTASAPGRAAEVALAPQWMLQTLVHPVGPALAHVVI